MSLYFDKDHALRLLTACKNDDVATLAAMINEDPALLLFESEPKERNLLLLATRAGSRDVVRWLLRHHCTLGSRSLYPPSLAGAHPLPLPQLGLDSHDREGKCALTLACGFVGCPRLVRMLLDAGADASEADGRGLTPLATAAWQGQAAAVEALLEWHRGTGRRELGDEGGEGVGPGRESGATSWSRLERGLGEGGEPEGLARRQRRTLIGEGSFSRPQPARLFPSRPPSPALLLAQTDARGRSPLYLAAAYGHVAVVSLLLAAGADPRVPSRDGKTASDKAEARGEKNVLALLRRFEEEPARVRALCWARWRAGGKAGGRDGGGRGGRARSKGSEAACLLGWRRGWWRGWWERVRREGWRREEEDEEDEEAERDEDEEALGSVYGAVSQYSRWRLGLEGCDEKVREGQCGQGRGVGREGGRDAVGEGGRAGEGGGEGGGEMGEKGEEMVLERCCRVARMAVEALPDDLFGELVGYLRMPWDGEGGKTRGVRVEGRWGEE